jgi:hypothetical protein
VPGGAFLTPELELLFELPEVVTHPTKKVREMITASVVVISLFMIIASFCPVETADGG